MANLGIIGLIIYLGIFIVCIRNLIIAWRLMEGTQSLSQFLLVQAVTFALLLQFGYGMSRPVDQEKIFWLLLGFSVALRSLAEQYQKKQPAEIAQNQDEQFLDSHTVYANNN
jgi:hypothetical protein